MKPFTEPCRYDYPLLPSSFVIDLGAHQGTFSKILSEKYNCRIDAYEPIDAFYREAKAALAPFPRVRLFRAAAGRALAMATFTIKGDMTGPYADGSSYEDVLVLPIAPVIRAAPRIDLLKLNVEGCEYDILDEIINLGLAASIANIQIQFHANIPNHEHRYASIRAALLLTHRLTYHSPYCWENYALSA